MRLWASKGASFLISAPTIFWTSKPGESKCYGYEKTDTPTMNNLARLEGGKSHQFEPIKDVPKKIQL